LASPNSSPSSLRSSWLLCSIKSVYWLVLWFRS
jgi:hypothetical protein